jgi:peptidase E
MKRLILMGGRPWLASDGGQQFVDVLFRYFPKQVNLAFCIFAQPESDWQETRRTNDEMFTKCGGQRQITAKVMTTENFAEISAWADIVYLPGGNPFTLKEKIEAAGDIATLWEGKVIAGSSAGADLFCKAYPYLQERTLGEGLGWLPVACIPHWREPFENFTKEDWDWAEQEVLKRHPNLPVLCIPEGQFVELTVK